MGPMTGKRRRGEEHARLRGVPGWEGLPDETIARIGALSMSLCVPPGRVLTRQGAPGREAFVIVEGLAAIWRDGKPRTLVGPGSLVGELALLDGEPRSADVVSVEELQVLVFDDAQFTALCDDPGFGGWVRHYLAGRLRRAES